MAGFIQDPMQFVNLIRDNLSDRYQSGFPVIKELIQNTDDAGATLMDFGLVDGLKDAEHPLLRGPGLFLINNGAFKESDARGIRSFGLNSKADDNSSIGKFGLGMKSVFHFCEAFFYVATDGNQPYAVIMNPWSNGEPDLSLHLDWDQFSAADVERIRRQLTPVIDAGEQSDAGFFLWLPLRKRAHLRQADGSESWAIVPEYAGDDSRHLDFLQSPMLPQQVAALLPLLAHLREVRLWNLPADKTSPQFVVRLQAEDCRRTLLQQVERTEDQQPESPLLLSGQVVFEGGDRIPSTMAFAGCEGYGWNAALQAMHEHDLWPASNVRDPAGKPKKAKDKARPHGAIFFSQAPGKGRLTTQWAVFLPLDDSLAQSLRCEGDMDYQLTLHGYFFIDAGRQAIDGQEHFATANVLEYDSDKTLKTAWNIELARLQVLPLILPALADFCQFARLDDKRQTALSRALVETRLWRELSAAITPRHAWLRTLDEQGVRWQLFATPARVRSLPEPPQKSSDRPWRVFPKLIKAHDRPVFVAEASPLLLDPSVSTQWQETELIELFQQVNINEVFNDQTLLDYLVKFTLESAGPYKNYGTVQSELKRLLRQALIQKGETALQQNRKMIQGFVDCLVDQSCLRLDNGLPTRLLQALLRTDAEVLPLPAQFIDNPARAISSLSVEDVTAYLRQLDQILQSEGIDHALESAALKTAEQVIAATPMDSRPDLLARCASLQVLPAHDCRQGRRVAISAHQMTETREQGLLFGFAQGTTDKERRGLADDLQRILVHGVVLLVNADTSKLVTGQVMKPCKGDAILESLGQHAHVLGDAHARSTLIKKLGAPDDEQSIKGLRYLLHAKPDHFDSDEDTLWLLGYEQKPAWQKLWVALNGGELSPWNLIDKSVGDALSRGLWPTLKISEIRSEAIQQQLMEGGNATELDSRNFSREECAELLADIMEDSLWQSLPLHWSCHGYPVSADDEDVYLGMRDALDEKLLANIHLIEQSTNPVEASRQRRLLKPLDEAGMLGVLLASDDPGSYWSEILDLLAKIEPVSNESLWERLRSTAWLPGKSGRIFAPEQVIDLEDPLEELDRILDEDACVFCLPQNLAQALKENANYEQHCRGLFSSGRAGLVQLARVLESQRAFQVGGLEIADPEQLARIASALSQSPYPGWRILDRLVKLVEAEPVFEELWPALHEEIELSDVRSIMAWITGAGQPSADLRRAYNAYLELFAADDQAGVQLATLRLLNGLGEWRAAGELVADAEGIAPVHLLDRQQAKILHHWITQESASPSMSPAIENKDSALRPEAVGGILKEYFRPWNGRVSDPLLAAFTALFGLEQSVKNLAAEYLGHHSLDWLMEQIPWEVPKSSRNYYRPDWLQGCSFNAAQQQIRLSMMVLDKSETDIKSILGKPIKVALDDRFDTLFIGRPNYVRRLADKTHFLTLVIRKINPGNFSDQLLTDTIKNSVRYLLRALYNQPQPALDGLWSELDKSDQVDIELTRALILENIPFYLKQLGAHKNDLLDIALREYDDARKQVAEFRGKDREEEFKRIQEKRLKKLQQLLEKDTSVQQSVLEAIRKRVRDYQYQIWNIPFEVFQNADDSVHQLEEIEAWLNGPGEPSTESLSPEFLRFVVVVESNRVTFMHWGRAINQVGSAGFPGKKRKFDNDLENMVILSASDKGDEVTGKFGLGFKSVLLVSDTPEIVSGRLQTRVIGGLLPTEWRDSQSVQSLLGGHQKRHQRGTAVSLPLRSDTNTEFLNPFIQRAGVLTAFSRKIRDIQIIHPDGSQTSAQWRPTEITGLAEMCVGQVQLGSDSTHRVARIDLDKGALLLGLGSSGFKELAAGIPNIWVTAPISESDRIGYAINGMFEIDAGRSRLAAESATNRSLGEQLGKNLERVIHRLFDFEQNDLKRHLELKESVTRYDLWLSLWRTLVDKVTRVAHDSGVRIIAQPLVTEALGRLAGNKSSVPNGLPGNLGRLLKWQDVRFIFRGVLAQPDLLQALGSTRFFGTHLKTEHAITEDVATWLRLVVPEFSRTTDQWVSQGFNDLLGSMPFTEGIGQQDASLLGKTFNLATRDELSEGGKALLMDFDKSIKQLGQVRFLSRNGNWMAARQLLCADNSTEEKRQSEFATSKYLLATDYDEGAIQFFLLCRGRKPEVSAEHLVDWMLHAQSDKAREAALRYLLEGDSGTKVAKLLLTQGLAGTWIAEVDENSSLLSEWSNEDRQELVHKVLLTSGEIKILRKPLEPDEDNVEPIDPVRALDAIYRWWQQEREERLEEYEKDIYPRESRLVLEDDDLGRFDRSSWLTLLLLGGFHILGRAIPQQHRGFIEDCQHRDWWRVFS
jgi:hypothetical protein